MYPALRYQDAKGAIGLLISGDAEGNLWCFGTYAPELPSP